MRVFLSGGTGFVGNEVLRRLTLAGHEVRCLVRPGSEGKLAISAGVEIHSGDATDKESLEGAMAGCDAAVHLVGIIREFPGKGITFERLHVGATRNMVEAAAAQGVKRYLQMSANGSREDATSPYHRTKWRAEQAVRDSRLDWTIFRPSVIFGPGDEFVNMLAQMIRTLPVVPVVGDGSYRMQPVAVEDVATGFVRALERSEAVGKIYHCGGPESYSYDVILDHIGRALGKKKVCKLHHPVALVKPAVTLFERFAAFPLTSAQLTMLLEGNTCDEGPWAEELGIAPCPFPEGIGRYLSGGKKDDSST